MGKTHPAGVSDITVEAALSSIMDCEDSVTAVDAQDKLLVYKVPPTLSIERSVLCHELSQGYNYLYAV